MVVHQTVSDREENANEAVPPSKKTSAPGNDSMVKIKSMYSCARLGRAGANLSLLIRCIQVNSANLTSALNH